MINPSQFMLFYYPFMFVFYPDSINIHSVLTLFHTLFKDTIPISFNELLHFSFLYNKVSKAYSYTQSFSPLSKNICSSQFLFYKLLGIIILSPSTFIIKHSINMHNSLYLLRFCTIMCSYSLQFPVKDNSHNL